MTPDDPTLTQAHFRIDRGDLRTLEIVARYERTTVSQLLRKIVAEWIRTNELALNRRTET